MEGGHEGGEVGGGLGEGGEQPHHPPHHALAPLHGGEEVGAVEEQLEALLPPGVEEGHVGDLGEHRHHLLHLLEQLVGGARPVGRRQGVEGGQVLTLALPFARRRHPGI